MNAFRQPSPRRRAVLASTLIATGLLGLPALAQQGPIKIGAILTTSGPAASLGEPQLKTLQMLSDEINAAGGVLGRKVQLIAYDDGGDPQKATVFAKRLIEADNADLVLGPTASGPSLAILPLFQQAGVLNISLAGAQAIVEPVRPYVFKMPASDSMAARSIFLDMRSQGIKKIAILHDTGAFGRNSAEQFRKAAPLFDIDIAAVESYDPRDTDTSVQITKMKAANADAFLVLGISPAPALVTRNYRDLRMSPPLYHTHAVATPEFLKLAGPAAEGVRIPAPPLVLATRDQGEFQQVVGGFTARFQERYGTPPTVFAGYAYDGFLLAIAALEAAGSTDRAKVRASLEAINGFKGVNGTYSFSPGDHLGLGPDSLPMAVVKDGTYQRVR